MMWLAAACATSPASTATQGEPAAATSKPAVTDRFGFEECTGEVDRESHTVSCPQFVLSRTVIGVDGDWSGDLTIKMTLATLRKGAETVGSTSDRRVAPNLSIDGGYGYAMILTTLDDAGEHTMGMTTFARPISTEEVVGVMCLDLTSLDPGRCEELSIWFATELPELAWVDVSRPTMFAGRMLAAPPGCALDGENLVICAGIGTELIWYERQPDTAPDDHLAELNVVHEAIVRMNRERTGRMPTVSEEGFDCRLDGEIADCKIYAYEFGANRLYVLVGVGQVRGVDIAVLCDWTSDVTDEIPTPCTLVVDPAPSAPTKAL